MFQDLECTKPPGSEVSVSVCCGSKAGKKGRGWASTKQAALRPSRSKRRRTLPGYVRSVLYIILLFCMIRERTSIVQVGANRSQITSEKWWEGAFNTALHVVNIEVKAEALLIIAA